MAANVAVGELGWDSGPVAGGDEDLKEKWALDRFCDGLLEKGALVPLSKKKRSLPIGSFSPPNYSVAIWAPLLAHVRSNHPSFPFVLVQRIIAFLLSECPILGTRSDELNYPDILFDMYLARWAFWIMDSWDVDEELDVDFKREVTVTLVNALGPGSQETARDKKAANALLQVVCTGNKDLEQATKMLLSPKSIHPSRNWNKSDMVEMHDRLNTLLSLKPHESHSPVQAQKSSREQSQTLETSSQSGLACGWRLFDETTGWRPCPIGVFVNGSVII